MSEYLPFFIGIGGAVVFAIFMGLAIWYGRERPAQKSNKQEICGCPLFADRNPADKDSRNN